ncbi:MAG: hypothetical protein RL264_1746 [Bacteroidota bacterium]|jgi:diacylglycerol kinase
MKKMLRSFGFALEGIVYLLRTERNFQVHFFLFWVLLITAFFFKINSSEWLAILICSALVFSLEAVNTAIEILCNKVQPHHDPQIKTIKDISAAAVVISAILSVVVALVIFVPRISHFIEEHGWL